MFQLVLWIFSGTTAIAAGPAAIAFERESNIWKLCTIYWLYEWNNNTHVDNSKYIKAVIPIYNYGTYW